MNEDEKSDRPAMQLKFHPRVYRPLAEHGPKLHCKNFENR
jgi:hypothetical protein